MPADFTHQEGTERIAMEEEKHAAPNVEYTAQWRHDEGARLASSRAAMPSPPSARPPTPCDSTVRLDKLISCRLAKRLLQLTNQLDRMIRVSWQPQSHKPPHGQHDRLARLRAFPSGMPSSKPSARSGLRKASFSRPPSRAREDRCAQSIEPSASLKAVSHDERRVQWATSGAQLPIS